MRELSIFVDESGDFGALEKHAPFYLLTLVFHNQEDDISEQVIDLDDALVQAGFTVHAIHTAPLIRREGYYYSFGVEERRSIFKKLYYFARKAQFSYKTFAFRKKEAGFGSELVLNMSKELGLFIRNNLEHFCSFERIVIYYDNGQHQVNSVLLSVFGALISQGLEIRNVSPSDYKLFQVADFICTIELLEMKRQSKMISRSEQLFFTRSKREFSDTLKAIRKKTIS
jgi:hypothetical protein